MFANSAPAALTSGFASCNTGFASVTGNWYGGYLADVLVDERLSKIAYVL